LGASRILSGAIIFYTHNGLMLFLWKTCSSPYLISLREAEEFSLTLERWPVSPYLASATIESDGMSAAEHLRE
jgi:hypothetical protein